MAIKVNPKKKQLKLPKGMDVLFQASIAVLVVVVVSYFVIIFLNSRAEETLQEINVLTRETLNEIPRLSELEKTAHEYKRLIEDFKDILADHRVASPLFPFIQGIIHPRSKISDLSIDLQNGKVNFSGEGESIVIAGQQFYYLKQFSDTRNVELSALTSIQPGDEGGSRDGVSYVFNFNIPVELFDIENIVSEPFQRDIVDVVSEEEIEQQEEELFEEDLEEEQQEEELEEEIF